MSVKYRAQILLEPEQHAVLADIAERENRSLSDLVRQIVAEWLKRNDETERQARELRALEKLTELRMQIQEAHGIYSGDLIEEVRAGQEEDQDRIWRGES
jgi:hypothetical protein